VYSEQLSQNWVRIGEYNKEDKALMEEFQRCI